MMVSQHLADLVHELQVGIGAELLLVFHKKNL
jgi:hypothetical protein